MNMKRLWKNSKGQSMVEFALIVPIMITLLLGTFDMGMLFFRQSGLSSMTKDVARAASLGQTSAEIQNVVENDANMVFGGTPSVAPAGSGYVVTAADGSTITITISPGLGSRERGKSVEVNASYAYKPISFFLPNEINLTTKSYTLVEKAP